MGMLVLGRAEGQTIKIGDEINVVVVEIKGTQVKLGISAPRNLSVDRLEIWESKKRERIADLPHNEKELGE